MALGRRVWAVGRVLVLSAALAGTYLAFAVVSARIALRAREVTVPDLSGRTPGAAGSILADLGLALRVDDSRRDDARVPAGRILAQEPRPGATARRGRSVRIWLSDGHRTARLPDLSGDSERSALLRAREAGVTDALVSEVWWADRPAGLVVSQEPPPGRSVTRAALLVSRGERPRGYLMPDLIGVAADRAAETLRGTGFRVAVVGQQPYPGVIPGIVIRQSPGSGMRIAPGQPIALEVSR